MCDTIEMPDGTEIDHFEGEDECLCCHTQGEILAYAVERLPELAINERVVVERSCFGWLLKIEKAWV
jgi:hypothetical protein